MSIFYQISISKSFGIINKEELELIKSTASQDEPTEIIYDLANFELFDETPLDKLKIIEGYEDDEYPLYQVTKNKFKKILDMYRQLLLDNAIKKENELESMRDKNKIDHAVTFSCLNTFMEIRWYFEKLIEKDKYTAYSGLFLIDYFHLVRIYENRKRKDIGITRHD